MKLSPSIISGTQPGVVGWRPEDLGAAVNENISESRVQDLIALLQLDKTRTNQPKVSAVRPSAQAGVKSWNPEELTWSSPFAGEDWMEEDHSRAPVAEPQEVAPVTSEELEQAHTDADAIIAKAQEQADAILRAAQTKLDETQRQALLTVEQARAEGYREGWAKADAEAASVLKSVMEIMLQFTTWRDEMFANGEPMLVEMVKQIARSMFGEGLELDPRALEINLNRVVENAKALGDLKVYLNPHDAEHIDPAWREYQQLISGNRVQIVPSDGITRGGCFVQGQMGTVDARVETQLKTVLDVFNLDDAGEAG